MKDYCESNRKFIHGFECTNNTKTQLNLAEMVVRGVDLFGDAIVRLLHGYNAESFFVSEGN